MDPLLSRQLRRFLGTGILAVSVDALSYWALVRSGVPTALAKGSSFMLGTIVAYFLNKNFTFQAKDQPWTTVLPFLVLYLSSLIANTAVNSLVLGLLHGQHKIIAFGAATFTSTVLNFLGQRLWVFRAGKPAGEAPNRLFRLSVFYSLTPALVVFSVFCLYLPRIFPSALRNNEMWAEGATQYFLKAYVHDFYYNITALDYSYLPVAVRAAALLVSGLGPAEIPIAYKWITLIAISLGNCFFALPMFRSMVRSDIARVVICLGLLLHEDYDLKQFINFPYHWIGPYFLLLVWGFQRATLTLGQAGALAAFFALCGLSKPPFVAFGPALALLCIWALRRRAWSHAAVATVAGLALCIQLAIMGTNRTGAALQAHPVQPLHVGFVLFVRYLWEICKDVFLGRLDWPRAPDLSNYLAIWTPLVGIWAILRAGFKAQERRALKVLLLVAVTALPAGILLVTVSSRDLFSQPSMGPKSWLHIRWFYLPTIIAYFVVAICVARIDSRQRARWTIPALACFLFATFPFGGFSKPLEPGWSTIGFSNWQGFAPHVFAQTPPRGCIPIDPYPWILGLDCKLMNEVPDAELARNPKLGPLPAQGLSAPMEAASWTVYSIGFLLGSLPHSEGLILTAYDQQGQRIGTAQPVARTHQRFGFFSFPTPATGVARIDIRTAEGLQPEIGYQGAGKPVWIWFGWPAAQRK